MPSSKEELLKEEIESIIDDIEVEGYHIDEAYILKGQVDKAVDKILSIVHKSNQEARINELDKVLALHEKRNGQYTLKKRIENRIKYLTKSKKEKTFNDRLKAPVVDSPKKDIMTEMFEDNGIKVVDATPQGVSND